jgi:hypothetical protein
VNRTRNERAKRTTAVVKLDIAGCTYGSDNDEAAMFEWFKKLKSVEGFENGHALIRQRKVDLFELLDLVSIFERYRLPLRQLQILDLPRVFKKARKDQRILVRALRLRIQGGHGQVTLAPRGPTISALFQLSKKAPPSSMLRLLEVLHERQLQTEKAFPNFASHSQTLSAFIQGVLTAFWMNNTFDFDWYRFTQFLRKKRLAVRGEEPTDVLVRLSPDDSLAQLGAFFVQFRESQRRTFSQKRSRRILEKPPF